jgi:hypothetical protein
MLEMWPENEAPVAAPSGKDVGAEIEVIQIVVGV